MSGQSAQTLKEHDSAGPITSVTVIGAGVMGRGIASANIACGIPVILVDSDTRAVDMALCALNTTHRVGARIVAARAATCDADCKSTDLVIEAITEKLSTKQQVLASVEKHVGSKALLASNTSSIPISRIAESLSRPDRFCGMHFCHPVRRRPLVEIVRGARTSEDTILEAVAYARALGKSPIVVGDCPGFVVNRLLSPYLNESLELILDGADVDMVEAAACAFGMPIGPLRQFDEYGIDVAVRTGALLRSAYPDRAIASELPVVLYGMGRLGRKTGAGFYQYGKASTTIPDDSFDNRLTVSLDVEMCRLLDQRMRGNRIFLPGEITMRLFLPMLLEATRVLEERIVNDAASIDEALSGGLGFLPLEGGLLRWADSIGLKRIVRTLRPLEPLGKRYEATPLLLELAGGTHGFYEAFGASSATSRAA